MLVYDSCSEVIGMLAKKPEGFSGVFRRTGYVALLPLLRLPYREVLSELPKALSDFGVSREEADLVSLSALVVFALRSSSEFWARLAIEWLSLGFPITPQIREAGDEMIEAKRGTQRMRHDLFRILRRWERNQ